MRDRTRALEANLAEHSGKRSSGAGGFQHKESSYAVSSTGREWNSEAPATKRESTVPRGSAILLPVLRFLAGSAGGAIVDSPARSEAECRETGTKIYKSRRDD